MLSVASMVSQAALVTLSLVVGRLQARRVGERLYPEEAETKYTVPDGQSLVPIDKPGFLTLAVAVTAVKSMMSGSEGSHARRL